LQKRFCAVKLSALMGGAAERIGIKDVAAAAGVSITTVSHALNGKGRLPEETRERVRVVAEALGYVPSATARSLARGRTGILAMTVARVEAMPFSLADFDYFAQLMNGASTAALERGYALVLAPAAADADLLDSVPLDGAIVVDPVRGDRTLAHLRRRGVPVVTTGREPDGADDAPWVDNDHIAGTLSILDHLAAAGARRVALITTPPVHSYTIDSQAAYRDWCARRGSEPEIAIVTGTLTEGEGYSAALELLDRDEPPDGIYATLDRLALGVLLAAHARGVDVPGELLVAGCTDSHASQGAALTALSLDPERIGVEAVESLIAVTESRADPPSHRYVPTTVIPRASTKG
jgi:DNA-binding LacI/PurR family transcriptional regulator